MPPPRRYTEEQYKRVLSSGENAAPPEKPPAGEYDPTQFDTWLSPPEWARNFMVGIPRTVTDTAQLLTLAKPLATATYNQYLGTEEQKEQGFGENFAESLYGKDGIAELQDFITTETQNLTSRLPAHLQNKQNSERIAASLQGSKRAHEILLKHADTGFYYTSRAQEAVNEYAGVQAPMEETAADEIMQTIGGAIIPIGGAAKLTSSLATHGANALIKKGIKTAIELSLPGSKSVPNAVANVLVQTATSQAVRGLTDQPSFFTGDQALAEEIAASGELTNDAGAEIVKTPSGKTVKTPDPVPDGEQGLGGWTKAGLIGGTGAAFIALGAMRGRGARGISKTIVDDTVADPPLALKQTPKDMLRPSLTGMQRRYSDYVNRVKPVKDVANQAMAGMSEADIQRKMEIIERLSHEAAPVNIFGAAARTIRYGDLPGLGRKTVPIENLEKFLSSMAPPERQSWMEGMQLKHMEGEYRKQVNSYQDQVDIAKNNIRNGTGSVQELKVAQARLAKSQQTGPVFDGMSAADARAKMAQFDSMMRNQAGERMYRQITTDIRQAAVNRGHYTQAEMDKITRSNPYYVPQVADPIEGATWWRRGGSLIKQELAGRSERKLYEKRAALFGKGGEQERIKNPTDPITALKNSVHDFHAYDRRNDAVARFVDSVSTTPEWGKSMREAHKPVSMTDFNEGRVPKSVLENNKVVAFARRGRIHFVEMADQEVARALQYNPGASMAGLDTARRFEQARLSGPWAPWFAWRGAQYEISPTRMLKKPNRSFGIIDSAVRRAFPNSKVLKALDYVPDPTVKLQMLSHAYGDITNNAVEAMSRKIALDLTYTSGLFHHVAQIPGGRDFLIKMADIMNRSFNDSMYTLLHKEGVLGQTFSNEPTVAMLKGYDAAEAVTAAFKPASIAMRGYRSVLDSVRSSAKLAFFSQNYQALKRKHNGQIPKSEIDKLIYETKVMSGDMTVSPGKAGVSKAQSTVTYLKTNMNSLAALGEAAVKRPTDFGMRFMTTTVAPKLWSVFKISSVPALASWYWNDLSDQERMEHTPVIKPEYFIDWATTQKQPELTPEYFAMIPDAPESRAFTWPMIAALQAAGVFGDRAQGYMNSGGEVAEMFGDAIDSLISIPVPAAVTAFTGAKGELQRVVTGPLMTEEPVIEYAPDQEKLGDSEGAKFGLSALSALFGSTADMAKRASGNVAPDDSWVEAAGKVMYHTAREAVERVPQQFEQFGAGRLFGGQRRLYATTGTRERMVETFKKIDKVVEERSKERRGLTEMRIADPKLLGMRDDLINGLNRNGMQRLKKRRGEINNLLQKLERERYKMSTGNYTTTQNQLQKDMQHINTMQQDALDQTSAFFTKRYGMSAEDALDILSSM